MIVLTKGQAERFLAIMANPPAPNKALRDAVAAYKKTTNAY